MQNLGKGKPLSKSEREFFEPRMSADFSRVRIHDDEKANELAGNINAKAFTKGNDVVFSKGEYSTQTDEGKKLMAHELTHVLQQNKDSTIIQKKSDKVEVKEMSYEDKKKCAELYEFFGGGPTEANDWNPKAAELLAEYIMKVRDCTAQLKMIPRPGTLGWYWLLTTGYRIIMAKKNREKIKGQIRINKLCIDAASQYRTAIDLALAKIDY